MAKDTKTTTVQDIDPKTGAVKSAEALFDDLGGQEIHVDRPIVDWDDLGDKKLPVVGMLVRTDELNLPLGSKRADGRTTWTAYLFDLTRPTRAIVGRDIVDIEVGRQVYVAANPKNKELEGFLGQEVMHEIAILGVGKIETPNRPMWTFRIKEMGKTKRREGQFLKGGPGPKALPVSMPPNASQAEMAAAKNEVPFS